MNQAFHNIVKNAIEAMHEKGYFQVSTRKLKISHGPAPHLQFAEIVFEDDGPGIGDEDIGQVLQPFYSKKQGGAGVRTSFGGPHRPCSRRRSECEEPG
jgi:signal transduction histidine kinase